MNFRWHRLLAGARHCKHCTGLKPVPPKTRIVYCDAPLGMIRNFVARRYRVRLGNYDGVNPALLVGIRRCVGIGEASKLCGRQFAEKPGAENEVAGRDRLRVNRLQDHGQTRLAVFQRQLAGEDRARLRAASPSAYSRRRARYSTPDPPATWIGRPPDRNGKSFPGPAAAVGRFGVHRVRTFS